MSDGSLLRLIAVCAMSLIDAAAAIALSGSLALGCVVIAAGGWATAQHDDASQRKVSAHG